MREIIEKLTCLRCGNQWFPRSPKKPAHCPGCNSPYWDRPRRVEVQRKAAGLKTSIPQQVEEKGTPEPVHGEQIPTSHPLNSLAKEMGYKIITEVPDEMLGTAARRIVRRFGKRSSLGMVGNQIKRLPQRRGEAESQDRKKLKKLYDEVMKL